MLNRLPKTTRERKRKGRGISAGQGKTAGRGTKGQKSRSGGNVKPGFEGGQMPLKKRVAKQKGFKSLSLKTVSINFNHLNLFNDGDRIDLDSLKKKRIITRKIQRVKVVCSGKLERKLEVCLPVSQKAKEEIEKIGGKVKNE